VGVWHSEVTKKKAGKNEGWGSCENPESKKVLGSENRSPDWCMKDGEFGTREKQIGKKRAREPGRTHREPRPRKGGTTLNNPLNTPSTRELANHEGCIKAKGPFRRGA